MPSPAVFMVGGVYGGAHLSCAMVYSTRRIPRGRSVPHPSRSASTDERSEEAESRSRGGECAAAAATAGPTASLPDSIPASLQHADWWAGYPQAQQRQRMSVVAFAPQGHLLAAGAAAAGAEAAAGAAAAGAAAEAAAPPHDEEEEYYAAAGPLAPVLKELQCVICHNLLSIFRKGGMIHACDVCHRTMPCDVCMDDPRARRVTKCMNCDSPLQHPPQEARRSKTTEYLIKGCPVACPHTGCEERLPYEDMCAHVRQCPHRSFACPFPGCDFEGSPSEHAAHVRGTHAFIEAKPGQPDPVKLAGLLASVEGTQLIEMRSVAIFGACSTLSASAAAAASASASASASDDSGGERILERGWPYTVLVVLIAHNLTLSVEAQEEQEEQELLQRQETRRALVMPFLLAPEDHWGKMPRWEGLSEHDHFRVEVVAERTEGACAAKHAVKLTMDHINSFNARCDPVADPLPTTLRSIQKGAYDKIQRSLNFIPFAVPSRQRWNKNVYSVVKDIPERERGIYPLNCITLSNMCVTDQLMPRLFDLLSVYQPTIVGLHGPKIVLDQSVCNTEWEILVNVQYKCFSATLHPGGNGP